MENNKVPLLPFINLNMIRAVFKPALEGKLKVRPNTLIRATFRLDIAMDRCDLSGVGVPSDNSLFVEGKMNFTEQTCNDLKISEHPIIYRNILRELKKGGLKDYKTLCNIYFTLHFDRGITSAEVYYLNINDKKLKKEVKTKF